MGHILQFQIVSPHQEIGKDPVSTTIILVFADITKLVKYDDDIPMCRPVFQYCNYTDICNLLDMFL